MRQDVPSGSPPRWRGYATSSAVGMVGGAQRAGHRRCEHAAHRGVRRMPRPRRQHCGGGATGRRFVCARAPRLGRLPRAVVRAGSRAAPAARRRRHRMCVRGLGHMKCPRPPEARVPSDCSQTTHLASRRPRCGARRTQSALPTRLGTGARRPGPALFSTPTRLSRSTTMWRCLRRLQARFTRCAVRRREGWTATSSCHCCAP